MASPSPVGAILSDMNPLGDRQFPFFWWALGAKFDYPAPAGHLFAMTGSAAEAFLLRAVVAEPLAVYHADRVAFGSIDVFPQHRVAKSRIDFAVHDRGRRLAVEVDGRQFHQKTHEQIAADYLRQRRVAAAGYSVIRFTAVEVFRAPDEAWRQVRAVLERTPDSLADVG